MNDIFLGPGSQQIAAGYVIFGPQTMLVVTFGNGGKLLSLIGKNIFIDSVRNYYTC